MPRAATTTLPARVERTTNSSTTGTYPPRRNETVQFQDKSNWRPSRIRPGVTICKTHAIARYHLSPDDLYGLTFKRKPILINNKGKGLLVRMYNLKEREVEMRAWEKCGGPAGFQDMLNRKAEDYYRKHGRAATFPKPRTYTLAPHLTPL